MSMRALGRSSARRGLAPALKKEHDLLKILLITLYRGIAFEDIMTKYSSLSEPYLSPSFAKVTYPLVVYFAFHFYLLYICSLAIFKEVYEKTVIGRYAAAWFGRLAEQYDAWQESRLPRIIPPPIRVHIDEKPKLQPISPLTGSDRTAAVANAEAAEASSKGAAPRSSPNSSPQKANRSESLSSITSDSSLPTDSASTPISGRGGASSSLSSLSTTSPSSASSDNDDNEDEKDAVPFPFSADPPPRSSPRASSPRRAIESSDESRVSSSSADLGAATPDFATPPQSPMPTKRVNDREDDLSEKTGDKEDNVGVRSDPVDSLQMPPAPVPVQFPEKKEKEKKKNNKKEKKPKDPTAKGESEEDEMTGQKEGDDSERAAKRRLEKMEKKLKKERESLRQIRAKKTAALEGKKEGSLRKIKEDKSKESKTSSSKKRKDKKSKNQFATKVARADSMRQRRDSSNKESHDKRRESDRKKSKGSKRDKKGETKKNK